MSGSWFEKKGGGDRHEGRPPAALLRGVGRVALWAAVGLLLVRGTEGVFSSGPAGEDWTPRGAETEGPGQEAEATATGFARTWLEDPATQALAPWLAEGVHLGRGRGPSEAGQVAQTEVTESTDLGAGRWVLTVSCDLRDARVLDLAVPVVRHGAGEAAVMGAPSIVAVPAPAGADQESPRPLSGPAAGVIGELVAKFVPVYLSAGTGRELSYLMAPGSTVVPLAGQLESVSVGGAEQLGSGEGPRRELIAPARVREPVSGAVYPTVYRLRVAEHDHRWYVTAVEGAPA